MEGRLRWGRSRTGEDTGPLSHQNLTPTNSGRLSVEDVNEPSQQDNGDAAASGPRPHRQSRSVGYNGYLGDKAAFLRALKESLNQPLKNSALSNKQLSQLKPIHQISKSRRSSTAEPQPQTQDEPTSSKPIYPSHTKDTTSRNTLLKLHSRVQTPKTHLTSQSGDQSLRHAPDGSPVRTRSTSSASLALDSTQENPSRKRKMSPTSPSASKPSKPPKTRQLSAHHLSVATDSLASTTNASPLIPVATVETTQANETKAPPDSASVTVAARDGTALSVSVPSQITRSHSVVFTTKHLTGTPPASPSISLPNKLSTPSPHSPFLRALQLARGPIRSKPVKNRVLTRSSRNFMRLTRASNGLVSKAKKIYHARLESLLQKSKSRSAGCQLKSKLASAPKNREEQTSNFDFVDQQRKETSEDQTKANNQNTDEDDVVPQSLSSLNVKAVALKALRAQRKFASNAPSAQRPHSSHCDLSPRPQHAVKTQKMKYVFEHHPIETMTFLDFLCFRGTSFLDLSLNGSISTPKNMQPLIPNPSLSDTYLTHPLINKNKTNNNNTTTNNNNKCLRIRRKTSPRKIRELTADISTDQMSSNPATEKSSHPTTTPSDPIPDPCASRISPDCRSPESEYASAFSSLNQTIVSDSPSANTFTPTSEASSLETQSLVTATEPTSAISTPPVPYERTTLSVVEHLSSSLSSPEADSATPVKLADTPLTPPSRPTKRAVSSLGNHPRIPPHKNWSAGGQPRFSPRIEAKFSLRSFLGAPNFSEKGTVCGNADSLPRNSCESKISDNSEEDDKATSWPETLQAESDSAATLPRSSGRKRRLTATGAEYQDLLQRRRRASSKDEANPTVPEAVPVSSREIPLTLQVSDTAAPVNVLASESPAEAAMSEVQQSKQIEDRRQPRRRSKVSKWQELIEHTRKNSITSEGPEIMDKSSTCRAHSRSRKSPNSTRTKAVSLRFNGDVGTKASTSHTLAAAAAAALARRRATFNALKLSSSQWKARNWRPHKDSGTKWTELTKRRNKVGIRRKRKCLGSSVSLERSDVRVSLTPLSPNTLRHHGCVN